MKMDCIICQDSGSEPLQDNINCKCKYKRHSSCWVEYVHSRDKTICPLCRKDLSAKSTPKIEYHQSTPYTSQLYEDSSQQITYQEFVDTIQQHNSLNQPRIPLTSTPPKQSKTEKVVKIVICLGIVIAIIVLIAIFV